jgi:ATP-dependent Lhr-like helicase
LPHYLTLWGKPSETALVTPGDPSVPHPAREALRQPGHEWERPEHGPSLSHPAQEALQVLSTWGACFADDLVRATGRLPIEIEEGLWELAVAGLATADCFDNLRALIDPRRRTGPLRPSAAKRRKHAQTATQGRWTLLRLPGSSVDTFEHRRQQAFEEVARQLLNRWGVVFRDLLLHESLAPRWRNLLPLYRRWEDRGEVQGGRFVAGCAGEQFALPEAVDALRSVRRSRDKVEVVRFSAADPLNLLGIVLPGARTRPHPDTLLTFRDGTPV